MVVRVPWKSERLADLTDLYPCLPLPILQLHENGHSHDGDLTGQYSTVTSWSIVSSCQLIDPAYQFDHGAASLSYRTTNEF
jgi:hypothetical protein